MLFDRMFITKIFFCSICKISFTVCIAQNNFNFYEISENANTDAPQDLVKTAESFFQEPHSSDVEISNNDGSFQDSTKTEGKAYVGTLQPNYRGAKKILKMLNSEQYSSDNSKYSGIDIAKTAPPQNDISKHVINTICSAARTNHKLSEDNKYNFLSESISYMQGGLGAFGVAIISLIIIILKKWYQKKSNYDDSNTSIVEQQNPQDDNVVISVIEELDRELRANHTDDTPLLIAL